MVADTASTMPSLVQLLPPPRMDKYLFSEDIHCGVTQILIVTGGGERADLELVASMNGDMLQM